MGTWEYTIITEQINSTATLAIKMNALGSIGWEAVGVAAGDPTIGFNTLTAVLKRPTLDWPPPPALEPDWHPDPTTRYHTRYWDGLRWTAHVATADGQQDQDFPNRR